MSSFDKGYCGICGDNKKDVDKLLKCVLCARFCHKICSGDSGSNWTCAVCSKSSTDLAVCMLCFKECNKMYLTKWTYNQIDCWIHPLCYRAEYTQNEYFSINPKIVDTPMKKKCYICKEYDYLIVDCLYNSCKKSFHMPCAWTKGCKLISDCRNLRQSTEITKQCEINKKNTQTKSYCYDYNGPYKILRYCDLHSVNHTIHRRGSMASDEDIESIGSINDDNDNIIEMNDDIIDINAPITIELPIIQSNDVIITNTIIDIKFNIAVRPLDTIFDISIPEEINWISYITKSMYQEELFKANINKMMVNGNLYLVEPQVIRDNNILTDIYDEDILGLLSNEVVHNQTLLYTLIKLSTAMEYFDRVRKVVPKPLKDKSLGKLILVVSSS